MTTRDRLVLMTVVALGILAAGWMVVVSPEREKAAKLEAEVSTAQTTLATARSQLSEAQSAQTHYSTAYASLVELGKAVPADEQVPSLVYELDQASNRKDVEFNSIAAGSSAGGSGSASSSTAHSPVAGSSGAGAGATAGAVAGFTQMPFTFIFRGTFFDLNHLLSTVDGFTLGGSRTVQVAGRLLTIQSISLERKQENAGAGEGPGGAGAGKGSKPVANQSLTGTITATAYVLPPGQSVTAGGTPSGPAGTSATPASGSPSGSSTPNAPAVVKVTP